MYMSAPTHCSALWIDHGINDAHTTQVPCSIVVMCEQSATIFFDAASVMLAQNSRVQVPRVQAHALRWIYARGSPRARLG